MPSDLTLKQDLKYYKIMQYSIRLLEDFITDTEEEEDTAIRLIVVIGF